MSAPSSAVNMRRVTGPLTSRGRRHEVARQSFAFERDLDRLDALGHVRRRLDERLARGAPPLLRRAAERIGEIFRRPVIHGGAQEMVARADALPAARGILAGRAQAVGERGEGWRPCAGILAPHGGTRREDLAHLPPPPTPPPPPAP